jgi:hypothetical protein
METTLRLPARNQPLRTCDCIQSGTGDFTGNEIPLDRWLDTVLE